MQEQLDTRLERNMNTWEYERALEINREIDGLQVIWIISVEQYLVAISIDVVDTASVKGRGPADNSMHLVAFFE